jgi:hypothetical protein
MDVWRCVVKGTQRAWIGGVLAVMFGVMAIGSAGPARAAPPFRTVLDLNSAEMRERVYYGFGLLGRGEICTTYFVDGTLGLQSTVGPTPGYAGYVIAIVVDGGGQVVADLEFRSTTCTRLILPSGSYYLQAIRGSGIFRMEVYDILS